MARFQDPWASLHQKAEAQARAIWEAQQNYNTRSDAADAFAYAAAARQTPRPPRSRFDGPDVIDLVQDADGAWRVPASLEHRMREP